MGWHRLRAVRLHEESCQVVFEVIPAQAQLLVQFLLGTAVGIKHINIISGRRIVRVKQKTL